jgi:Uma2 family endonuclease
VAEASRLRISVSSETAFDTIAAAAIFPPMPQATTTPGLLTVEDYRATPEGTRYQLIEGELYAMSPSPRYTHQAIIWNFSQIFGRYLQQHPVGRAFVAPFDVYLSPNDVVQPDVFFLANEGLKSLQDDGVHGAPDLVIEILSPSTAQLDKKQKRRIYARAGVKELWLVDPLLLQIQRYDFARDTAKPVQLIEEDETFSTPLLPGLAFSAADIFKR